jgi:tRNA A37 methylthiotransferase MiaB
MRRFYTTTEFETIVKKFKASQPHLTLATDVIVGFPGETEEAFENTLKLLKQVKPDIVNVSKFFARPKTVAWKMKERLVEREEIKRRSTVTSELSKQLSAEQNRRWVGWSGDILVDEKGKIEDSWVGRNFAYKPIVIKNAKNLLGKTLQVTVVEALGTYLKGEADP